MNGDGPSLETGDLAWEYFRASGPGGQHRNKVATGVRLTHIPSGITVSATERRSREANRKAAVIRLKARLAKENKPVIPRKPTRPGKAARRRRLEEKKLRARLKHSRRRVSSNDYY